MKTKGDSVYEESLITLSQIMLFFTIITFYSCGTTKKAYYKPESKSWQDYKSTSGNKKLLSLFLIGDAGEFNDESNSSNYVLSALKKHIQETDGESSLVYLGDNILPEGLPNENNSTRVSADKLIESQLALADEVNGFTYFIPGNHDWKNSRSGGLANIKRQAALVNSYDDKVKFYPDDGCGDPKVVKINSDLVFVFIDSQWWLQDWSKEKMFNKGCETKSRKDLLHRMEEIFLDHKNDEIVVFMHHPIKSNGIHGGHFSLKHHIFPLHEKGIWVPLPILGSGYPVYRNIVGTKQDNTHALNRELTEGLNNLAHLLRVNVVFVAGHDKGLQYFEELKVKYIISGGGSKKRHITRGNNANYARSSTGYAKINFYENFEAWVEFYTVEGFGEKPVLDYRTMLRAPREGTLEEENKHPSLDITKITAAPSPALGAGPIKKLFLGEQYRDIWTTPVHIEAINLEKKMGGLTPIKKGGGMASNSLRLERADGKQYILRSLIKDYFKLVPPHLRNLVFLNVIRDQISANHPYGALLIPPLSKAAGVYYTTPKLVYLKNQKGLGNYNSLFSEELYLLEERPTGDWSDAEQFGNSSKIIGYTDLLAKLVNKKRHFVDQKWVCKSRMFDLFIHDWDRHDDQWRWASFKTDDRTVYRPIPRDRDQAFYKFVGLIPRFIGAAAIRQFQTMKGDVKRPQFLSFNARHFDRYFLNDLEWSEWAEIIIELQNSISDEAIEESLTRLPKEVHGVNDEEIIRNLKSRRANLLSIGKRLYKFLSTEVEITGTDNDDHFEITRYKDGKVKVISYILEKNGDKLVKYDRVFYANETKEIRIYGLRGKDKLTLNGSDNNSIKISFIGGEDDDKLISENTESKIYAYDEIGGIELTGANIKDKTSSDLNVNEYDRNYFMYNSTVITPRYGSTRDDGSNLGLVMVKTNFGWRKSPYASRQKYKLKVAPFGNGAVRFDYIANFPNRIGKTDLSPHFKLRIPEFENWFGLGNESVNNFVEREFNWVRMRSFELSPLVEFNGDGGWASFKIGPSYELINIVNSLSRVSNSETLGLDELDLRTNHFLGGLAIFKMGFEDNVLSPSSGLNFEAEFKHQTNLSQSESLFNIDLSTDFYISLIKHPQVVFANVLGYRKVYGDPQFHQFPDLGNDTNLRGFRDERFRGESVVYHNMDLRLHLFNWNNKIIPLGINIYGGFDYGRAYHEFESSDVWHHSTTIGLSLNVVGAFLFNPSYSMTDEGDVLNIEFGYSF